MKTKLAKTLVAGSWNEEDNPWDNDLNPAENAIWLIDHAFMANPQMKDWPVVRERLGKQAEEWKEKDPARAHVTRQEIKRLDEKFGYKI